MHIILAYPEHKMWPVPSLGILYVAAVLEKAGHEVEIFDLSREYFLGRDGLDEFGAFLKNRPDVEMVGVGFNTPQAPMAYRMVSMASKLLPKAQIALGGPHPTALPEMTLKECPEADVIVLREGEYATRELAARTPLERITGIVYRDGDGYKATGQRELIQNLDELPFPAWRLIDMEYYLKPKGFDDFYAQTWRMGTIMTTRGCFGRCNFCFAWGMLGAGERAHSPERIVREIEHLIERYGITTLNIYDDTLFTSKEHGERVCHALIDTGLNKRINFNCQLLSAQATPDTLGLLKEAGCYQVGVGFESFISDTLKNMRKPVSYTRNIQTVRDLKKIGIRCLGYFMSGYQGEVAESVIANQDMQKYTDIELPTWTNYVPFPGTKDFNQGLADGTVGDLDWITFDMSQNPLTMLKRNYSSIPHGKYVYIYLSHLENFIFLRRFLNGIERRIARFTAVTNIEVPLLKLPHPGAIAVNEAALPIEIQKIRATFSEWDVPEAHRMLQSIDLDSLDIDAKRYACQSLLFIHLIRMEDDKATLILDQLKSLLGDEQALATLARANAAMGNFPNALRILRAAKKKAPIGREPATLMMYQAMLQGRPALAQMAVDGEDLAAADMENFKRWSALEGSESHKGLPDIFLRYQPNSDEVLELYADKLDAPISAHHYRFLGYYLPLKDKLVRLGVKKALLLGFDRWTRMLSQRLLNTGEFELLGMVDDRIADIMPSYGDAPIVTSVAARHLIDGDTALIITGEHKLDESHESLTSAIADQRLLALFDNKEMKAPNLTHQLYALSRELKGSAVLKDNKSPHY
jgi:radical SAM superfamily enzyme YgiQ (UPF0313 family)